MNTPTTLPADSPALPNVIPLDHGEGVAQENKPIFFAGTTARDDDHKIIPVATFDPESLDGPTIEQQEKAAQCESMETWNRTLLALLQWLSLGEKDFAAVGRRAVAALLHVQEICGSNPTQTEYAKQFGISGSAMSKLVKATKPQIAAFFQAISDWNP